MSKVGERVGEKVGERVGETLTDNQQIILACMQEEPHISAAKIAKKIGISFRKTEENIKKLRIKKCIKRSGSARGGHWEIIS
jgi:ATP-dependent DNA helicase RecG